MWVEINTLKVGDLVEVRRQVMTITKLVKGKDAIGLVGETVDGRQVVYKGVPDEMVKRARQMALAAVEVGA